ncbi:MAG: CoA protein activase [Nitrospirae bacterium]|nr:CoA protein activase [Nitrospirota bacterium]
MDMVNIGLDAGSVSVKLVIVDSHGSITGGIYKRHKGQPLVTTLELLQPLLESHECNSLSVTGSSGRLIGSVLGIEPVNEVVAHAYATKKLYPTVRTIIELGGEDSKLIVLEQDSDTIRDFSMNSVCAAGTGSFLDQQAERLRLTIEEFSSLSLRSKNPPRIAGRCSVFAKSDMIHLQQIATPVEDIVAGLCFAVARNFKGSIARGRSIAGPVSFQGGVAANAGMERAFNEVFGLKDLFVPKEHAFMGAIGAALKDMASKKTYSCSPGQLQGLSDFISSSRPNEKGHQPLIREGDGFQKRHVCPGTGDQGPGGTGKLSGDSVVTDPRYPVSAFLGVDIGSISTNLAVIDGQCNLLAKRYLMTAGRPIEAVKTGLREIAEELGSSVEIVGVGTTGSGRYMIADYIGADIVKNEITAQATAAAFIDKDVDTIFEIGGQDSKYIDVDTIFEIGGQDSKYISLRDGVIVDFEMNKACAAGTGSFLEEQAEKLSISVKGDFERSAFLSTDPCRLGERCTVFMENSLMANLQRGAATEDLLAGLSYSIVQNYINRVVCKRPVGRKVFFQGGVAFNKSVVAAFEKYLGTEIIVPPNHDVTGAIGMALIAMKHMDSLKSTPPPPLIRGGQEGCELTKVAPGVGEPKSRFKGFGFAERPYEISSFECKGCPNVCEINRIRVEGEDGHLFYGGRCEKYDVRKNRPQNELPDLFRFREEKLWETHLRYSEKLKVKSKNTPPSPLSSPSRGGDVLNSSPPLRGGDKGEGDGPISKKSRPKIGIPYVFYFQDYLPFWSTLLWELGFDVIVSPPTDRKIIDLGLENILAETCFPVKTAAGHIRHLIDSGVDTIFIPSFVELNTENDIFKKGVACPYTQTMPYSARMAFRQTRFLTPIVSLHRGDDFLRKQLIGALRGYRLKSRAVTEAIKTAWRAQADFISAIKAEGGKVLSGLRERAVVIVGRSYNSFDRGMNLNIPKKLADLGVISIPMDFLPIEEEDISAEWPDMYWRAGQRILSAARIIRRHPLLHAVYIGSFSCGPDSFIIKFFEEELAGRPYLHLEIDAHSADAGAITRCEAFMDSVSNNEGAKLREPAANSRKPGSNGRHKDKRTVFIPRMSDHTLAVAAAFQYCGTEALVLPEPSRDSVDLGRKFVSGKECYPCAVTTGDMAKKIAEPGFDPDRAAFFMPSGSGPCRFGQYNIFQRMVIRDLGLDNTPVLSPVQNEDFYKHLGNLGKNFTMRAWEGIIAIELLTKCLHETRPYEKEKGASDAVYTDYLDRICRTMKTSRPDTENILGAALGAFKGVPADHEMRPLIGIVGEIFVRSNKFSNEDLVRRVESLGGEAYLAPVEEWLYYVNYTGRRAAMVKKDFVTAAGLFIKNYFQKKAEHRLAARFHGHLKAVPEPKTEDIIKLASPYVHHSFEGETILSIGKSIDMVSRLGARGIISAMPFGCMPGTIVSGLMRGLTSDLGMPCLSIPYDGTESSSTTIQLEAFMDQARESMSKKQGTCRRV